MRKYFCDTCHFIYDEIEGDSKNGVPPKTPLKELCNSLCNRCQMKDLNRYHIIYPEYNHLEAKYYSAFSGKWHVNYFLDYLNQISLPSPIILEIGTGSGRVASPLVSLGFQVTSVERSPSLVSILKTQRWTNSDHLNLIEGDVFTLDLETKFDVILLTDATLQELIYQQGEDKCLELLSNFLAPNGIIWIETMHAVDSHRTTRRKNLDLKREIILESNIKVAQEYFTYHHLFELFQDGLSIERNHVTRTIPALSLSSILTNLPDTLELKDNFHFPKEAKIKSDQSLANWTDGGYPLPTSNKLVKKEIIILKNKGDLS